MYVCIRRTIPERSGVADTILVDSQQPILQDDHSYSTVDEMQQQTVAISSNLAYEAVSELSQQPLQGDDQTYSNLDISQEETVMSSGNPKHGTTLGARGSTK